MGMDEEPGSKSLGFVLEYDLLETDYFTARKLKRFVAEQFIIGICPLKLQRRNSITFEVEVGSLSGAIHHTNRLLHTAMQRKISKVDEIGTTKSE